MIDAENITEKITDPVATLTADLRLVTGKDYPSDFVRWCLRSRPEYVEDVRITAETLRILDPSSSVHIEVVQEMRKAQRDNQD